jgi:hypothetical protein
MSLEVCLKVCLGNVLEVDGVLVCLKVCLKVGLRGVSWQCLRSGCFSMS